MSATDRFKHRGARAAPHNGSAATAQRIAAELDARTAEEVGRRLRVLGHPTRIALVVELAAGPRSVAEVAAATGLEPAAASKHLRELQRASVVVRGQDGTQAIYALVDATVLKVLLTLARTVHAEAVRIAAALSTRS